MRVAVAGATGFLGGEISRVLAAHHEVVALPRGAPPATTVDALVWAAGKRDFETLAGHAVHFEDPVIAIDALRPRRVIYLSSGEVYGDAPRPIREAGPLLGHSTYARAKLAGELAVHAAAEACGAIAIALRVAVAYGRDQRPAMLIPQLLRALRANHPIALTAGTQTRDFIHAEDVARAVEAALHAPAPPRAINIGTGVETAIRDVCLELARLLHRDRSLLQFGARNAREGEPASSALDIAVARRALAWTPRISLAEGLYDLVRPIARRGLA